ncbi:hypothetical protein KFK09_006570 [Dendrobium nobile]|uniref:Uncharacterized protein n=1 Tax=Dendrobium nobile TaxID=94219 RepID=A0A8T3BRR3_DENNO|nr:hypothetical protein KFK09_006570 [Dendrobium nobile]
MEGLIPLLYRAIVQYRNGSQATMRASWLEDSPPPSISYIRLPSDSGRFRALEINQFISSSSASSPLVATNQLPSQRSTSRRHI